MNELVDASVREEIRSRLDLTLCVEAGAGTGKTTALVSRIVELIRRGRATVDNLAVITFTEKAAAELASRVREGLEAAARNASPEEATRLTAAIAGLARARIETIHAFCRHLLAERPVEARLDPNFRTLNDLEQRLSFDTAYAAWARERFDAGDPVLRRAFNRGLDSSHLRTVVEEVHRFRALLPFEQPTIDVPVAPFLKELADAVMQLETLAPACRSPDDRGLAQIAAARRLLEDCRRAAEDEERVERILLRTPTIKAAGSQRNWQPADACRQQKEICERLGKRLDEVREALRSAALASLIPLAETFVRQYAEERRARGVAEFDDLLVWARDLLRDHPEVRRYFQERFAAVLVDEFQDTDALQVEILLLLTSRDDLPTGERRPAPGALFVVGDPKQSIYRFRRADVATYLRVRDEVLAEGRRWIVHNFRSVSGVIAWVNRVFAVPLSGDGQVGYTALAASRAGGALPAVAVLPFEGSSRRDEQRANEAGAVAAAIRAVLADGWPVHDAELGAWRPARAGDIVVLLPTRRALPAFERALGAAGIPFRHEGGRAFFDRQEVHDLVAVLRAIDDPTDGVWLLAALRSAAFGCSDDAIARAVAAGWRLDYRAPLPADVPEVADACRVLRSLHDARASLSLVPLLRAVLRETRLVEFAQTLPRGEQAAANLLKVLDQARAFAESGSASLRPFLHWIEQQRSVRADEADAPVADLGDEVVRLLTIHAAKGLEFPIVILSGLAEPPGTTKPPAFAEVDPVSGARRLHLRVGNDTDGHYQTPGYEAARKQEQRQEEAERQRLLYVAATRARDRLIVPVPLLDGAPLPLAGGLTPFIWPADGQRFPDQEVLTVSPIGPAASPPPPPLDAAAIAGVRAERAAWRERRAMVIARAAASHPVVRIGEESAFADAFHAALVASLRQKESDLLAIAARAAAEANLQESTSALLSALEAFRASEPFRRVRAAAGVRWNETVVLPLGEDGLVEARLTAWDGTTALVALLAPVAAATLTRWREALRAGFAAAGRPDAAIEFVPCWPPDRPSAETEARP
ncbi:MAG: UvrD-helicase domain-containing protein [Chloroflexota bacterium]|nr:UvrD-helicase domain-containing protein [Dehalococcoidia bacterium]MDW8255113.1 UvrD-helicase domain-containing protein [Chloroflexota bacterium]